MTKTIVVNSTVSDSAAAGSEIGRKITDAFNHETPDALILFASSRHDYNKLLVSVNETCHPKIMMGCSSAGEFTTTTLSEGSVTAIAIRSTKMHFTACLGRGLRQDRIRAARQLGECFQGKNNTRPLFRYALVLTDALAGFADELIEELHIQTGGLYQFFGGGAGDDAHFKKTHVFCGTEAFSDAVVALEILSYQPLGIGVRHDWLPATPPVRVTASEGMRLVALNAVAAGDFYKEHARQTGQTLDSENPVPFFLHNVIGIDNGSTFKLRVPLSFNSDGSINCAANIPVGATVRIMRPRGSAADAVAAATKDAIAQLRGSKPLVALFFDCVASRLRMGHEFGFELDALRGALGGAQFAGCNTYGQIALSEGQFSGFHNCTAVVCVLPQ